MTLPDQPRKIILCVGLAALLVLAGCGGTDQDMNVPTTGSGATAVDEPNSPTATTANAPSSTTATVGGEPTDQSTPSSGQELAPGITAAGISDFSAVIAAHDEYLSNQSFTANSTYSYQAANGTALYSWNQTLQRGTSESGVASTIEIRGNNDYSQNGEGLTHIESWVPQEGTLYQQREYRNGTTNYERQQVNDLYSESGGTSLMSALALLDESNTQVVERERNGTPLYIVTGERVISSTTNESVRLAVDQQGFIHEFEIVTETGSAANSRYVTQASFSRVGETKAPEPPEWLDEARQQTQPRTTNGASAGTTHLGTSESSTSAATESGNTTIDGLVETTTA